MKKRKAKARVRPLAAGELASNFTRGVVTVGLLTAIQDRWSVGKPPTRKLVRQAMQGGVALAAGIATAESLRAQDYLGALTAVAGGALGALALETLLTSQSPDTTDTTEPAQETDFG